MSTLTPNYSLVKPDPTEVADVTVVNSNSDIIDTELKNREIESVTSHSRIRYSGTRQIKGSIDNPTQEYVILNGQDKQIVDIIDQDLLNLISPTVKKINLFVCFDASRQAGSGEVLFDLSLRYFASEGPSGAPGGSLITYGRIDEGGSFSTFVDERAYDTTIEDFLDVCKVSGTSFRNHQFMFTALPVNASNQISLELEFHNTSGVSVLIRNVYTKLVVEW